METAHQTSARLRRIAEAEARSLVDSGRADAVALTGSASSGRVWPSSDIDILFLSGRNTEWEFRWTVREGTIVHGVLTPWEHLEAFRERFPERMIEAATWRLILDATWSMDGLVAMVPLHDPAGRLAAMQAFMRERRFAPEVVRGRRPLLIARAAAEHQAGRAAEADQPLEALGRHHAAVDLLGIAWLEAGERITSHKELELALDEVGRRLGVPELAGLFRRALGVEGFMRRRAAIESAFAALWTVYNEALEALLTCYPTGDPDVDRHLADHVYSRHIIASVPHALARDCVLHLASVRKALHEQDLRLVPREAAERGRPVPVTSERLEDAVRAALATLEPAPRSSCHAAFEELLALTSRL